jgi:hypothetical protein
MFFYPWCPALMLVVESNNVIDTCFRRMATGGVNTVEETLLMVRNAVIDAGSMLISGRNSADVIEFYRPHVAANAARLI